MGKYAKILAVVLSSSSDANIDFDDLCKLLELLGFTVRIRGSHHNFFKEGVEERINLQRDGNKAKQYQVRQVRSILIKNNMGGML
ncbi:MAG: type II toxin-antitoxin system HicA family toxin [Fibrobacter sp.]|nr:type II toxin-antitoxin system HicA family toxin [Fibrobacter sp.]